MNLDREKEVVGFFHYDTRNPEFEKQYGTPETNIRVQFQIIEDPLEKAGENDTTILCNVNSIIVLEDYVLSASVEQINYARDQKVEKREDLTDEEMRQLSAPLLDLLKRLTYEVTEVATDQPGLKLEF